MVITTNSMVETTMTTDRVDLQQAIAELHDAQHVAEAADAEYARLEDAHNLAAEVCNDARIRVRTAQNALLLAVYQADPLADDRNAG